MFDCGKIGSGIAGSDATFVLSEGHIQSKRPVCRNVKRWRDARMALRWTAAGMLEAGKGFRRLNACKQLPVLKAALEKHRDPQAGAPVDSMTQAV